MTIYADLSPSGLLPSAVLEFVKAHAQTRAGENILFKVTREVFELFMSGQPKPVVISQKEASAIGAFLGTTVDADQFILTGHETCTNCGRALTFYDFFDSGRKRHGDAFMHRFLGGGEHHIQVAGTNEKLMVNCSNCGTLNVMLNGGNTPPTHYSGTTGGSAYTYV